MKKHSSKAFIHFLDKIGAEIKVFEQAKSDRRLNQIEQQILHCWNLLRSNQFEKILQITSKQSSDTLYQSQFHLLHGIALHNSGNLLESIDYFHQAIQLMKDNAPRRMIYIAYYNLFNAHQNLKLNDKLKSIYEYWEQIPRETPNENLALKRANFRICLSEMNIFEAEKIIFVLESMLPQMSELNRLNFHIDLFDLFLTKKDFKSCEQILVKLKKYRSYHSGSHYKYLKKLIDYNLYQTPFYVYERDFKENKILFNELSVLKHLEEKNVHLAQLYWNKLKNKLPHLYGNAFHYQGPDCLFSISLFELSRSKADSKKKKFTIDSSKSKEIVVYEILLQYSSIEKNELYEMVWKQKLESKIQLAKLQSIISRFNQKHPSEQIKYRKGCYVLINKTKKAS
jgi:tetratricopeptide (TPR) repeat protein